MTVLGRSLVFQPVLVTHVCTYDSNNIITLQNIDITDLPSKKKKKKENCIPTPPPQPTTTTTKEVTILANVLTCHVVLVRRVVITWELVVKWVSRNARIG